MAYTGYDVTEVMTIKGKYGFRVTLQYDGRGSRVRQHSGFAKKGEAKQERNAVIAQLHAGSYVTCVHATVGELLAYWLEEVMRPEPSFTANSYHTYKNCIDRHIVPKLGKLKVLSLNAGHLRKLYRELAEEYVSIPKLAKTILNTAMNFAVGSRLAVTNPCKGVDLPKNVKRSPYHTIVVKEAETLTLEQVKELLAASRDTRIHMQLVFALLMGLRRSEINGLKYSDVDFLHHKLKVRRQLGEDLHADETQIRPKMKSKQEIRPKTPSGYRELDIPDYVYDEILRERKIYEKNRSRRQTGTWSFQDLDYICCSSYGRPRSQNYHFVHYKELLKKLGFPDIPFHNLRHTYATLLMKNDINQKAVAAALGHSRSIITVDTYTDLQAIIEDCVEEMQAFIEEVHPYEEQDLELLAGMFGEHVENPGNYQRTFVKKQRKHSKDTDGDADSGKNISYGPMVYDYSDVEEMADLPEWYWEEGGV